MFRRRLPSLRHALNVFSLVIFLSCLTASLPVSAQTTSGTLLGAVRDKSGKGVAETKVFLENEENGNRRATRSDDSGNYAVFNLPPGTYKITVSKQGFRDQTIKSFPVQFNQKNVVKLPLFTLQTATLNGRVIDTAGNGLPKARVIVVGEDKVTRETVTGEDGGYTITDLPPGNYNLTALWADRRRDLLGTSAIPLTEQTMAFKFVAVLTPRPAADSLNSERRLSTPGPSANRRETSARQNPRFRPAPVSVAGFSGPAFAGTLTPAPTRQAGVHSRPPVGQTASASSATTASTQKRATSSQPPADGGQAAALVNTTDAARSNNFNERQIHSLPVPGNTTMRSFDEFALLLPGVSPPPYTPGIRGPGVGYGIGTAGQFSVNGMRARANNFSVDGSDNNDPDVGVRRQGFVALVPQPLESIKEVSISTLLWDAELGRNVGGQVNAVSKYGANEFHGQAYVFFNDSRLNARNFFDTGGKPPLTRTQFGGAVGGPIVRNRTQFFVSFEHDQTHAAVIQHFAAPALAERNLFGPGQQFLAPAPTGPFTDATPLGRNVLSLYPLPNNAAGPYSVNTYTERLPADGSGNIFSFRLTQQVKTNHSFNVRYNFTDDGRVLPSVNGAIRSTLDSHTRSHNVSIIADSALGPRLFNQARFSFGRTELDFLQYPGSPLIFSSSSIETNPNLCVTSPSCSSQTGPIGELSIVPYSSVGVNAVTFPQRRASNTFQYADSISLTSGNHVIKFGGNIRRYQLNSVLDRLYRPQVVYGGALLTQAGVATPISGVRLASLGVASSVFQTVTSGPPDSTIGLRFTELQFFINDNWNVHPRLSLDLGLRYELNTVPREVNNRIEDALQLRNLPAAGASRFDTADRTFRYGAAVDAYRSIVGGRTGIYDPDRNNFGPHIGLAWAMDAQRKSSLRAGYGIYYDTVLGAVVSQSRNVFPTEIPINVDPNFLGFDLLSLNNPTFLALNRDANNNLVQPPVRLLAPGACNQFGTCNRFGGAAGDFAALIGQLFIQNRNGGLAFTLPQKRLRTPYAQQWHLTVERELFNNYLVSAAYVGTRGTKLLRLTTPNRGPNVTPQIAVTPPQSPGQLPFLNITTTQTGFILILPDADTCPGGGGVPVGPPNAIFCLEPDDRPNPFLGPYQLFESSANSNYHALQLEARTRYHRGYQFTAAYTWSHAIDDVSDVFPIAGAPIIAQDSANLRAERASANFDIRHRFAASLLWDVPFFRNSNGVVRALLNDWQIASVFQAQTGQPFTLNVPFDANLDGNLTDRASTTNGLVFFSGNRPERVAVAPGRSVTDFFVLTKNGAVGRNTARGAGLVNLDLSVSRTVQFAETKDLLFRVEFFNLLNRANFGLPVRTIGAPGFGSAVDTATPARMIVLVVKSSF